MTEELEQQIKEAVEMLMASGAQEVYLFGSSAVGDMHADSDIDLAVSGLPPECFYRAMGQAVRTLNRSLDMVDLDERTPFTEYLRTKGKLLRVA